MTLEFRIKVFLSFILTALFFILASPVSAQTLPSSGQASTYNLPTTVSPTSPIYTDLLVHNLFHTFSCLTIGSSVIGQPCLSYQVTKDTQGAIQSVPVLSRVNLGGGALGATTSLIGALYANPPVRTVDYLASVGQGLGIVKEARAQVVGSGAGVLNPILNLWQVSRNIAYLAMIIIFVVIGLMVMFRNRINPQTVITAQAALPGLVIGLILITFSYFLAALMSDTSFIGTNLVGYYFGAARGNTSQNLLKDLSDQNANALSIFSKYVGIINKDNAATAVGSIWTQLDGWVQFNLRMIGTLVAAQFSLPFGSTFGGIGQLIAGTVTALITNLTPEGIVGWLLSLMAMVILIYAMLRLLLRLIKNYLSIIFLTVTAPFQFLAAALPGRQGIATAWVLNMLANALAFPAVLAVLYFVAFILGKPAGPLVISATGTLPSNGLVPTVSAANPPINIVDINTFPLFGGMDLDFVRILLAFGALVALPAIPDIIARTIGRVGVAGQLLGEEYAKGVAGGRGYYSQAAGAPGSFAERAGRMTDTKGRIMAIDERESGTGRILKWHWEESEQPYTGATAGTVSRIKGSAGGQWIGRQINRIRGR